jgi:hypothetical protein
LRIVILESPYAGDVDRNVAYARACVRHALESGEAPFASHLLYTQCLDDLEPAQRELGIRAGFEFRHCAAATVVYVDRGISRGMREGIEHARDLGQPVEFRELGQGWDE